MQERVILNVSSEPLADSLMDGAAEYSPVIFVEKHRQEIFAIIDNVPSFATNKRILESRYERFRYLLDLYQEQPSLLDSSLDVMMCKLLAHIKWLENGQTRFDDTSNVAFAMLTHISKVRKYKVLLSRLPHDVKYMEKVLSSLERYADSTVDMDSRYILLLWLIILCKNPFDLNKFGTKNISGVVERIVAATLPYLYLTGDKCQRVSAMLLALVATREDTRREYLNKLLNPCVSAIKSCSDKWSMDSELVGSLHFVCALLKQGRREDLLVIAHPVLTAIQQLADLENSDFVIKKLTVKASQRLGMVFLKPRITKWRYHPGNRCLTSGSGAAVQNGKLEPLEIENSPDEISDVPHAELEAVLGTILKALRDCDTYIRWTGAKGVGRIVSRLPKHLANDVLSNIFKFNFNPHSGNAAWHGGCLAIAELARRGFLLLEKLPDVVEIVLSALVFEEPQGRHAVGSNVRDAACYICWSLARAFRPQDLTKQVEQLATSLVCVALFDREINVRRAASAAFQENVGRQGTFPYGIDVLTKIDYFAVGQRSRAYLEISCQIAKYSMYAQAIMKHLIYFKITHWDEEIRLLAAEALYRLCLSDPYLVSNEILEKLLPMINDESVIIRQGGIVALAAMLSGLKSEKRLLDRKIWENAAQIPGSVYSLCEKKTRSLGFRLMRRAMNIFIKLMSSVMPENMIQTNDWFRCLDLNICDEHEDIRKGAFKAAAAFFELFTNKIDSEFLTLRIRQIYLHRVVFAEVEFEREGIATLLGAVPKTVLLFTTPSGTLATEIIHTLTTLLSGRTALDLTWAYGRRSCVEAIAHIVESVGIEPLGDITKLLTCLIKCLDDYTKDKRGDVGRILREEAMRALAVIIPLAQKYCGDIGQATSEVICKIIQQSAEKIDATRECAALVMNDLLNSGLKDVQEEEILRKTYAINGSRINWRMPSCFKRLAILLKSPCYRYHVLSGFIISAGGLTESTKRGASDALLSVFSDIRGSRQELEIMMQCFASILSNNAGLNRVVYPLLCTLEQILSAQLLDCFETNPDLSPSLRKIIDCIATEVTVSSNALKVRMCVTVVCHFLHFNSSSHVWHKSASLVVRTLRSRYPTLRRSAAEQLYECIASEWDSNDEAEKDKRHKLLNLLSETKWHVTDDEQYLIKISHIVDEMLNSLASGQIHC